MVVSYITTMMVSTDVKRTFQELASICLTRGDFERDDVPLRFVEKLDGNTNLRRSVRHDCRYDWTGVQGWQAS